MKILLLSVLLLTGCTTSPGKFTPGQIVQARSFSNAQYNGEAVRIVGERRWRFVKRAWALEVYEIETMDGRRFAAQDFQLKEFP